MKAAVHVEYLPATDHSRAGTLLYQGFAPNPTYYAPKIFI
jgi:hypothetical protein